MSDYVRRVRAKMGNEFLLMPSVTALVFDEQRRVLLVRPSHRDNVWAAPGGAVDPDEAPQDAVVREVWEETGLLVEPTQLRGVFGGPEYRVWYANGDDRNLERRGQLTNQHACLIGQPVVGEVAAQQQHICRVADLRKQRLKNAL